MFDEPKKIALRMLALIQAAVSDAVASNRELPVKRRFDGFAAAGTKSVRISRNGGCDTIKGAMQRPADMTTYRATPPLAACSLPVRSASDASSACHHQTSGTVSLGVTGVCEV